MTASWAAAVPTESKLVSGRQQRLCFLFSASRREAVNRGERWRRPVPVDRACDGDGATVVRGTGEPPAPSHPFVAVCQSSSGVLFSAALRSVSSHIVLCRRCWRTNWRQSFAVGPDSPCRPGSKPSWATRHSHHLIYISAKLTLDCPLAPVDRAEETSVDISPDDHLCQQCLPGTHTELRHTVGVWASTKRAHMGFQPRGSPTVRRNQVEHAFSEPDAHPFQTFRSKLPQRSEIATG
jgi:hypothetical protein